MPVCVILLAPRVGSVPVCRQRKMSYYVALLFLPLHKNPPLPAAAHSTAQPRAQLNQFPLFGVNIQPHTSSKHSCPHLDFRDTVKQREQRNQSGLLETDC